MHIWWPIKLISDQLWDLIWEHLNDRFSIEIKFDLIGGGKTGLVKSNLISDLLISD